MTQKKLSKKERDFFTLVNRAVFANPFSSERVDIDQKIAGADSFENQSGIIEKTVYEVRSHIRKLEKSGHADICKFSGEDREIIENAFLFEFFYNFRQQCDDLIMDQIRAGEKSLKVPFAEDAFRYLKGRGFSTEKMLHYMAICYQLRRAFFFIGRSLIGNSPSIIKLRRDLWDNVFTHNLKLYDKYLWNRMEDFSTLVLGETGTGKGTAAMAIGQSGFIPYDISKGVFVESFAKSFVSLNLSQYPETLIESELFGHKKGAFTGAFEDYSGVFDRCSPHGAIFLDEIGEVSEPIQIKLLQVLQERIFTPVGGHKSGRFSGRVIAATNSPINKLRSTGAFRDDFYYRLCSDVITVPSLRQRLDEDYSEMKLLLEVTVEKLIGEESPEMTDMVYEVIQNEPGRDYNWPGNVRELEQCVRRIILKKHYTGEKKVSSSDLKLRMIQALEDGDMDAKELMSGYCTLLYKKLGTYEAVAKKTGLDRRTVKKHLSLSDELPEAE